MATLPSGGSEGKASACNAGDSGLIPGSGRSPGERNGKPIPVLLPGESHGGKSLVGYSPWGRKESDSAEATEHRHTLSEVGHSSRYLQDWRRQWHPIPVLLPGESHGRSSLVGCSPWGR